MWNPILEGALAADALMVVKTIAENLRRGGFASCKVQGQRHSKVIKKSAARLRQSKQETAAPNKLDASVASGSAGLAVLFAYLEKARIGHENRATAVQFLEQAMDTAAAVPMRVSLFAGFSGIAWTISHLDGWLVRAEGATETIDRLLEDYLSGKPWLDSYDLIDGLVGFGVYTLERVPSLFATKSLAEIVDRLGELAERTPEGITWLTPPSLLPEWQRQLCPLGYYNLGVAHGVPGVMAFLARVCALDRRGARIPAAVRADARSLLTGASAWLLSQKCEGLADTTFPDWVGPGVLAKPSRVAWCYGDLGIAVVLLATARCLKNTTLEREAISLARRVAERSFTESGVKDGGFCHGAAGVSHLFNRLFQATGDLRLKEAGRTWYGRTLQILRSPYAAASAAPLSVDGSIDGAGLLQGAAGSALVLLAAVTDVVPDWDRLMLMALPDKSEKGGPNESEEGTAPARKNKRIKTPGIGRRDRGRGAPKNHG